MLLQAKELFARKNKIVIGYDLSDDYAQISVLSLDGEDEEPETISLVAGAEQYQIPVALCKRHEVNQWFYGREALRQAQENNGVLITQLCGRAKAREQVVIGEESFDAVALLALFIKRSLSLVPAAATDLLSGFMITSPSLDHELIEMLSQVMALLQLKTDRLSVQSHVESFYEYMIHQPKELWKNQVVIFDFAGEHMCSYRMECNKRTSPVVAFIEAKEHAKPYKQPFLNEADREKVFAEWDEQLCQVAEQVMENKLITTVYLIGDGFYGEWCRKSLKLVCRGRRVFQGNNLYSKGACYGMREKIEPTQVGKEYVFLGNEKLKANVGMRALRRGEPSYYALLDAGMTWYEAAKDCEIILESGNSFSILVTPVTRGPVKELEVILDGLTERSRGTTRLALSVKMVSAIRCRIEIEDLGFGEIAPATHKKWQEEFEL